MPDHLLIKIKVPPSLARVRDLRLLVEWFQQLANRLLVGALRYEIHGPQPENMCLSRLRTELKAYERNGNREHLRNLANYAYLESVAPQHPRHHDDPLTRSATRRKFGGRRA